MQPIQIKPNVYWVGVVDWNLRDFHGYSQTRQGTSYNAYVVLDDKITLFDTVSAGYQEEFLHSLSQIIDPGKIDYLVVNHGEPDHAGSLPYIVQHTQPERIFCSKMGQKFIQGRFNTQGWPLETVNSEQVLSLGSKSVQFLETRMLHWPDSMVSYIPEDKLLISQDAFGQNIASTKVLDQEQDWPSLKQEMATYFANIILPYSSNVFKSLQKIQELGWEIDMIAPDHGLVLQKYVADAVSAYQEFAAQKPKAKAVIFYDTMWKSTETMARTLASALGEQGLEVKVFHLKRWHHSEVMAQVWDAAAILAGSPTHNNGIMPLVADMLTYMQGLKPQNKLGAAFGSYGWSGESPRIIQDWLQKMGMETVLDPIRILHVPGDQNLLDVSEKARTLAQSIWARVQA
ncbi:MAG: FprA family A-type flavoprotein [Desulfohalobiaceae bacterium]